MSRHRIDFTLIVEGSMEVDLDEGECPKTFFLSSTPSETLSWAQHEVWEQNATVEVDALDSECLDPPLVQLAREATDA